MAGGAEQLVNLALLAQATLVVVFTCDSDSFITERLCLHHRHARRPREKIVI